MRDPVERQSVIDEVSYSIEICNKALDSITLVGKDRYAVEVERNSLLKLKDDINLLPSAQPEWNNHTVACLLAELFDDTCACNYNGIDEWLPEKCELLNSCPNPSGVACWEQFLKHKAERRTDETTI